MTERFTYAEFMRKYFPSSVGCVHEKTHLLRVCSNCEKIMVGEVKKGGVVGNG